MEEMTKVMARKVIIFLMDLEDMDSSLIMVSPTESVRDRWTVVSQVNQPSFVDVEVAHTFPELTN